MTTNLRIPTMTNPILRDGSWSQKYLNAMLNNRDHICADIESHFGLYGYPPEVVSVALRAADDGEDVDAAVIACLSGELSP
jgi:hypothetical protein